MIEVFREIAAWALILAGGFFLVVGAIGLHRMPEIFTRLHAASLIDTTGAGLMLAGLMAVAGFSLVTVKLAILLVLLWLLGPVATHAVARAALQAGIRPWLGGDGEGRQPEREEKRPWKP